MSSKQNTLLSPNAIPLKKRLVEVVFTLLIALAIFLFVCLISYDPGDGAWSTTGKHLKSHNLGGPLGAWFADITLFILGFVAYLLPVMLGYLGILCLQGKKPNATLSLSVLYAIRCLGALFFLIGSCGLTSLHFSTPTKLFPGATGGMIGLWLTLLMVPILNVFGTSLVFFATILTGLTLSTGLSWLVVLDKFRQYCFCGILWILKCALLVARKTMAYGIFLKEKIVREKKPFMSLVKTDVVNTPLKSSKKQVILPNPSVFEPMIKTLPRKTANRTSLKNPVLPELSLLKSPTVVDTNKQISKETLAHLSQQVELKLKDFNIEVKVVSVYPGPVIIRFELSLAAGIKASRITTLANDLARALSVQRVRVVEVIPGKTVVGLEIPNTNRELVVLKEIFQSVQYLEAHSALTLGLGKDISGIPVVVDLTKMPHLLVAGTTGSGKSVGVNAMLLSLLYKATPQEVRLILVDPKMLELSVYDGIPHLLTPVVTDMKDASSALRWCVGEMERRYQLMAAVGVRNVAGFNRKVIEAKENGQPLVDPLWPENAQDPPPLLEKLPFIVVIIDEFADLMMVVGKKIEQLIARIAQKARAAGIHMILATQRPSVDVITGLIKANIPTRIAFQVSSRIDSRTILDQSGAEQLLGFGDMLYLAPGTGMPIRVHGAFVSDEEVHRVVGELKSSGQPDYVQEIFASRVKVPGFDKISLPESQDSEQDVFYDQAVAIVQESRKSSISYIQRRLKIGYNRAARLVEAMESAGILGPIQENGQREVLVARER